MERYCRATGVFEALVVKTRMRTPRNILRHELIGLECVVVKAANASHVGLHGRIVDETQKTIVLETTRGQKRLAKQDITIVVTIGDERVELVGHALVSRPEDRIKRKFQKW